MSRNIIVIFMLAMQLKTVAAAKENPIRKIVRLMQDMSAEIEAEKKKEGELFEKFMCICNTYPAELQTNLEGNAKDIESLSSKIEEETALKSKLAEELKQHAVDKDAATKDLAKATTLRGKETAEYEGSVADLKGSIAQLDSAIPALEAGGGASALLQNAGSSHLKNVVESSVVITDFDKKQVLAFLSQGDSSASTEYTASSGEILGILKQMKDDMAKSLEETENAEQVASAGFADLKAAKDQEIELASEAIEAKEKKTGELAVSIAQTTDAHEDTLDEQADNQKMLSTLVGTCDSKKLEFEARLKLRTDEIAAISEAVSILNDDDALDVFKKAVPAGLVETSSQSGFLQTQSGERKLKQAVEIIKQASGTNKNDIHLRVLLEKMSSKLRSSSRSAQGPDFGAVKTMIDEMVAVLTKEGEEDAKKKEWCIGELAKADKELAAKQEKLDSIGASISELEDEISGLAEDITALETATAELDKSVASATETRKSEHAGYVETLQLTEAAVGLIGKAKNRLAKFYNPTVYKAPPKVEKSMEEKIVASYGFVQRHSQLHRSSKQLPEIPELPAYEKKNSGGVVALMDKIVSDLEKDKAGAGVDDKHAQAEYVSLMAESQATRAANAKGLVNKKAAKAEIEKKLVTAKESKVVTGEEVMNAHTFLGDLHSSCDFVVENFGMRKQARETELESLKSAKAVLSGASF
jgi:predicted nuclease with TOPRIM domain